MKMKQITIIVLIALMLGGYSAEAKKKQKTYSLPVLKQDIEGFSKRFLEIDQDSIKFSKKSESIKVKFKKVADFPHNYVPRFENITITPVPDVNLDEFELLIWPFMYKPTELYKLDELMTQPVGSTVEVKLRIDAEFDDKVFKKAKLKGMALTYLEVSKQSDFEEVLDFVMELKKVTIAGDKKKFNKMIEPNFKKPDGEDSMLDFLLEEEGGYYFPFDADLMKKLTREKLKKGYYIISSDKSERNMEFFSIYYDKDNKGYHIEYKSFSSFYADGEWVCEPSFSDIFITKVKGKYKIVDCNVGG